MAHTRHPISLVLYLFIFCYSCLSAVVTIPAGEGSMQNIVDANPPGTTFMLSPGVHRYFSVKVRSNDVYIGQPGTILTGGRVLTGWQYNSGLGLYYVTGQAQQGQTNGECLSGYNCLPAEDLFMDNKPLRHALAVSSVPSGGWFFDYANDIIYMKDDPSGHAMETSLTRSAFYTNYQNNLANNVVVTGVFVEKYAVPAQMGAIGDQTPGSGWTVSNCTVTRCHGTGITVGTNGQILNCVSTNNGQKGVGGPAYPSSNVLVEGNSLSFNNYAGFNPGWEAAGSKFAYVTGAVFRNNHAFNNSGYGLWTDIDIRNIVYDGNVVEYNTEPGISHEISYSCVIKNNYLRYNGWAFYPWLWGAEILIQNSQNCRVFNNVVIVGGPGGNAMSLIYQNRGSGQYGPWLSINNSFTNNNVYFAGPNNYYTGGACDIGQNANTAAFWGQLAFDYNNYYAPADNGYFFWDNRQGNWAFFRSGPDGTAAQEPHGTFTVGPVSPPPPPSSGSSCPTSPSVGSGTGLAGDYYLGGSGTQGFQNYAASQIDSTINFNWNSLVVATNGNTTVTSNLHHAPLVASLYRSPSSLSLPSLPPPSPSPLSFSLTTQNGPTVTPTFPSSEYSVRWTGQVQAQSTSAHTFSVVSDDGARLWVNGQQLINYWVSAPASEHSGTISLTAGQKYNIVLEYYQQGGGASVSLSWTSPCLAKQIIPQSQLYPCMAPTNAAGDGLTAKYYNDKSLSSLQRTQVDPQINFDWGNGGPAAVNGAVDNFSVQWTGFVQPRYSGTYTFYASSDDGARIYVDGKLIVDAWYDRAPAESSGTITLDVGRRHAITYQYYENGGGAVAQLRWSHACEAKAIVPQSQLFSA